MGTSEPGQGEWPGSLRLGEGVALSRANEPTVPGDDGTARVR